MIQVLQRVNFIVAVTLGGGGVACSMSSMRVTIYLFMLSPISLFVLHTKRIP